jgi:hypothetical protein
MSVECRLLTDLPAGTVQYTSSKVRLIALLQAVLDNPDQLKLLELTNINGKLQITFKIFKYHKYDLNRSIQKIKTVAKNSWKFEVVKSDVLSEPSKPIESNKKSPQPRSSFNISKLLTKPIIPNVGIPSYRIKKSINSKAKTETPLISPVPRSVSPLRRTDPIPDSMFRIKELLPSRSNEPADYKNEIEKFYLESLKLINKGRTDYYDEFKAPSSPIPSSQLNSSFAEKVIQQYETSQQHQIIIESVPSSPKSSELIDIVSDDDMKNQLKEILEESKSLKTLEQSLSDSALSSQISVSSLSVFSESSLKNRNLTRTGEQVGDEVISSSMSDLSSKSSSLSSEMSEASDLSE